MLLLMCGNVGTKFEYINIFLYPLQEEEMAYLFECIDE